MTASTPVVVIAGNQSSDYWRGDRRIHHVFVMDARNPPDDMVTLRRLIGDLVVSHECAILIEMEIDGVDVVELIEIPAFYNLILIVDYAKTIADSTYLSCLKEKVLGLRRYRPIIVDVRIVGKPSGDVPELASFISDLDAGLLYDPKSQRLTLASMGSSSLLFGPRITEDPALGRKILYLSLTSRCACNCAFCGIPQRRHHSTMAPELLAAALTGHPAGHPWEEINITGGDPLIDRTAYPLFSELRKYRRHYSRVTVCTSGIPARRAVEGLSTLDEQIGPFDLYVSFDGVGHLHDDLRGVREAFSQLELFLREARRRTERIVLATLVNARNWNALESISEWAFAQQLPLAFAVANGSDFYLDNLEKFGSVALSKSEGESVLRFFSGKQMRVNLDALQPILGRPRLKPCRLDIEGMFVTSDGEISTCGGGRDRRIGSVTAGNHHPVADWYSALSKRSNIVKQDAGKTCRTCVYVH